MPHVFAFALTTALLCLSAVAQEGSHPGEWRHYAGNHASTKYSALNQIDAENVGDLEIAWHWISPDNALQETLDDRRLAQNAFEVTPLYVDGILYTCTNYSVVVAIDPGTGETLIAEIARIKPLTVISRTSAMHYKNTQKTLAEIATELGIDALVEGSVTRAGNRVRITAQLIDAVNDVHLWADRYDGTMEEILDLQATVALAIAKEVNIALTPEESAPLRQLRPVNPEAFDALMKSKYAFSSTTAESFEDALHHIHAALTIDPEHADAHAFLAAIHVQHAIFGTVATVDGYFQARISALDAIRLGGESSTALWALAHVARIVEWDWDCSLEYALRAAELNPSQPEVLTVAGADCAYKGDFAKAYEYLDRALESDLLDPRHYMIKGSVLIAERRFDEAIEFNSEAIRRLGGFDFLRVNLAAAYVCPGAIAKARRIADELVTIHGEETSILSLQMMSVAGFCFALTDRLEDAEALLDTLRNRYEEQAYRSSPGIGIILLALGRVEEAYSLLERSYRKRDFLFLWLNLARVFECLPDPLDDRIKRLLARMNLASSPW